MIEYERRDEVLAAMGYDSYAEYLNSRLWKRIRERVLKRRSRCACGEKAAEVHHRDYRPETMRGSDMSALVPLCPTCHELAEFETDGRKATLSEANRKIDLLASLVGRPVSRREHVHVGRKSDSALKKPKGPNKRKMILAKIPPELLPPVLKKQKRPLSYTMRIQMPKGK